MMDDLSFLPIEEVTEGMAYLKQHVPDDPAGANELLTYFDQTYVTGTFRNIAAANNASNDSLPTLRLRPVPPMFPPPVWNVFDATLRNDPRSNNLCEGWNNKFYNLVGHYHPSVWRAITWMQKEQEAVSTVLQQDALGQRHRRKVRTCHVKMQERLRNLCLDRQSNRKTIQQFLRGISWNIRLNKKQ